MTHIKFPQTWILYNGLKLIDMHLNSCWINVIAVWNWWYKSIYLLVFSWYFLQDMLYFNDYIDIWKLKFLNEKINYKVSCEQIFRLNFLWLLICIIFHINFLSIFYIYGFTTLFLHINFFVPLFFLKYAEYACVKMQSCVSSLQQLP